MVANHHAYISAMSISSQHLPLLQKKRISLLCSSIFVTISHIAQANQAPLNPYFWRVCLSFWENFLLLSAFFLSSTISSGGMFDSIVSAEWVHHIPLYIATVSNDLVMLQVLHVLEQNPYIWASLSSHIKYDGVNVLFSH